MLEGLAYVEQCMGSKLGDPSNPLLLSVRSGAAVSMPAGLEGDSFIHHPDTDTDTGPGSTFAATLPCHYTALSMHGMGENFWV